MTNDPVKDALHRLTYGLYSITSRSDTDANAMVANWVTQASFSPRLIAVGLAKKAHSHSVISEGEVFAVNIFNRDDKEDLMPFTAGRAKRPAKMEEAAFTAGAATGCPILEGAAAYVECKVVKFVDVGGDHDILVGEVVGGGVLKDGDASNTLRLTDLGWSYAG